MYIKTTLCNKIVQLLHNSPFSYNIDFVFGNCYIVIQTVQIKENSLKLLQLVVHQ